MPKQKEKTYADSVLELMTELKSSLVVALQKREALKVYIEDTIPVGKLEEAFTREDVAKIIEEIQQQIDNLKGSL